MVQCFAPDCNHQSERETCKFFRFPKDPSELNWWKKLLRQVYFGILFTPGCGVTNKNEL